MTSTAKGVPLRSYRARPHLTLPEHPRPAARFPIVDAHSQPGRWLGGWAISGLPFERHGLTPGA